MDLFRENAEISQAGGNGKNSAGEAEKPEMEPETGISPQAEAFSRFLDLWRAIPAGMPEHMCRAIIAHALHPGGPVCPEADCRAPLAMEHYARWAQGGRVQCRKCGRQYFCTSGTVLDRSKLKPKQAIMLFVGLGLHLEAKRIGELAQVSTHTVRDWQARIKAAGV